MHVVSLLFPTDMFVQDLICVLRKQCLEMGGGKHGINLTQSLNHFFFSSLSWMSSGLEDYMRRYGEGIRRVLASFGPVPEFSGEGAKSIFKVSLILM